MGKIKIHEYEKDYQRLLRQFERENISSRNRDIVLKFKDFLFLNNISKPRVIKYFRLFETPLFRT